MKRYILVVSALVLVGACAKSDALTDDAARGTLSTYVKDSFCAHSGLGSGCSDPKLVSMTPLTERSPTERQAGAKVSYVWKTECTSDITVTFAKAAAGGWVLQHAEGVVPCGPPNTLSWASPTSFTLSVK